MSYPPPGVSRIMCVNLTVTVKSNGVTSEVTGTIRATTIASTVHQKHLYSIEWINIKFSIFQRKNLNT